MATGWDTPVAVGSVLPRQLDDPWHQPRLILRNPKAMPLSASRLGQHPAGAALRGAQLLAPMGNSLASLGRAQKSPAAASFGIALSSTCSARGFFSRAFSFSSSFRRLA